MENLTPIAPLPSFLLLGPAKATIPHQNNGTEAGVISEGARNTTLAGLAGAMRRKGMSEDAIFAALRIENDLRCRPPLPENEIRTISKSIGRYEPEVTTPFPPYSPFSSSVYPWPEPLGAAAYHGLTGEFVRLVEPHTEADPAAMVTQFLVACGNVIGRGPHFVAAEDKHHTNLFALAIGISSKSRKGTSMGHVRGRMKAIDSDWEKMRIQTGLSSGEGMIWAVRDPISQSVAIKEKGRVTGHEMVVVDPGVDDKRLLALQPEFATTLRVLERDGNSLSGIVRQSWDSGGLQSLTKNSPAVATDAHISIIGHITKEELTREMTRTEMANGFANRFLFVCCKRSKLLPEGGRLSTVNLEPFHKKLQEAVEFAKGLGDVQLKRDEEARQLWIQVYPELSEGKPGLVGAVISRAEAQVMRLALLYALLDKSFDIQKVHLEAALEIWRYAEASARYVFGDMLGNPLADEVLSILRACPEGLTRTDISSRLFGHHKSVNLSPALALLQSRGLVNSQSISTAGRSAERWYALGGYGGKGEKAPLISPQSPTITAPIEITPPKTQTNGPEPQCPTPTTPQSDLYRSEEEELLKNLPKESLDNIAMVKKHFPGSRVVEINLLPGLEQPNNGDKPLKENLPS